MSNIWRLYFIFWGNTSSILCSPNVRFGWIQILPGVMFCLVKVLRLILRRLSWFKISLDLLMLLRFGVSWVWQVLLWFCWGFFAIALILTKLTQNGVPSRWSDKCKESYHKLKTALTTSPMLVLPRVQDYTWCIVMLCALVFGVCWCKMVEWLLMRHGS